MNIGAVIMLIIGMVGLWGGLIAFVLNYLRASREESRRSSATAESDNPERR